MELKKTPTIFACEKCDFECSKQSEWTRHIARPKHKKTPTMQPIQSAKFKCSGCGCAYRYASGLWKHSRNCAKMNAKSENDTIMENRVEEINTLLKTVISNNTELHNKNVLLQQQLSMK